MDYFDSYFQLMPVLIFYIIYAIVYCGKESYVRTHDQRGW